MKFFENFFGPKHIYFCSDFLTKTSPSAVSHLYHEPYKRLIYSSVSKTLQYLAFLESAPGRQAIIDLHVRGIIDYANEFYE